MTDHIPEEVMIDILARLSVKDIVKSRSVCKSWYSLISSKYFQSYHLNKPATQNRSLALVRDGIDDDRTEHYSLYLDDDDDFPRTLVQELDCPFKAVCRHSDLTVLGCCNGVVCLIDHTLNSKNDRAALWNPSIRKLVEIPPPIVTPELGHRPAVGFGYDALNDDYKLVRVSDSVDVSKGHLIEVYSWRCGCWRMVDSQLNSFVGSPCVHVDGVCYWLGSRLHPGYADLIVSFTLCNEVFDEFPLPSDLNPGGRLLTIGSLWKGSLCLLLHEYVGRMVDEVTIWVMNEGAWTKLVFMELESCHIVHHVLAFKENDVVLFTAAAGSDDDDQDECLVRLDLKTRVEEDLMVANDVGILSLNTGYIESLVLLE